MNDLLIEAQINALNRVACALEDFNSSLPLLGKRLGKIDAIQAVKADEKKTKANIADCIAKVMPDVEKTSQELKKEKAEGATNTNRQTLK